MNTNRQNIIKSYLDYGFTAEEIAEELDMDLALVRSALQPQKMLRTQKSSRSTRKVYTKRVWRTHSRDKTIQLYEILYKFGVKEINRNVRQFGLKPGARYMHIRWEDLYTLKIHFGYHNPLPGDALDKITYFSEKLRRAVDERDHRTCIRCNRKLTKESIRYHKITHPGPMNIDNCATLCKRCRICRIIRYYKVAPDIFHGMTFNQFKQWIDTNDYLYAKNVVERVREQNAE